MGAEGAKMVVLVGVWVVFRRRGGVRGELGGLALLGLVGVGVDLEVLERDLGKKRSEIGLVRFGSFLATNFL